MNFFDVTDFIGGIIQFLGLLLLGFAAGWFTLSAFKQAGQHWQLQTAVFLGIFFFTALLANFSSPGGLGGFALGLGGGLLYWGVRGEESPDEETPDEEA